MDETRTEKQDVIHYVLEQCEEKELDKIVMVGDRSYDILGGHAEGLKVIGVLAGRRRCTGNNTAGSGRTGSGNIIKV